MSDFSDKELGLNRRITRRDLLNGAGLAIGATLAAGIASPQGVEPQNAPTYYPPALTGMRGSHEGSYEAAHQLRDRHPLDPSSSATDTGERYDLVVVGGGISGLSAAYFFLQEAGRSAKVLILDNHDDFGGHAKRNEFRYGGKLLVLNGGTLNIESPLRYNPPAKELLKGVGLDLDRYVSANAENHKLYSSLNLRAGYFFDRQTWGQDYLLRMESERRSHSGFNSRIVEQTPLSPQARQDLLRICDPHQPDYMPGLSSKEKKERLAKISYDDYLLNVAKVGRQVLWFFSRIPEGYFCVGTDATPALFCWEMGLPGFAGLQLDPTPEGVLADLPGGQHGRQKAAGGGGEIHFPDGNATVARLLVRSLLPDAVPGASMEDVSTSRVNYALLDREGQPARIRLSSTAVHVQHEGDPSTAKSVAVTYVANGKSYRVQGAHCVLACWNMMIPYITPNLSAAQQEALAFGVKGPIVYTNVAIRNWKAFQKLGVRSISSPTMYHSEMGLAEAVSLGGLKASASPEEPIVVQMERCPGAPGKPRKEQHRIGRAELLATPFPVFERNIRDQMARTLGPGGFDPATDIVAITVNRWPHGYAYTYNSLYDPLDWVFTSTDDRPCVKARQRFGRISIANSDAAASPHTDAAILEAHRAVAEQLAVRST